MNVYYTIILVVIVNLQISKAAVDTTLLFRCCSIGTEWASNSERCDNYPSAIEYVHQDLQRTCLSLVEVCCMKQKHRTQCIEGKTAAAESPFCVIRDDVFGSEQYKECCQCCRVGIEARSSGSDCNLLKNEEFGGPCDQVYKDCCLGLGGNSTSEVEDIDECELYPNKLCSHTCVNTIGSYRCVCPDGYNLHQDESTCIRDTRIRCEFNNPCQQICQDTDDGVQCRCNSGYTLASDLRSCKDRDECREGIDNCSNTTQCVNYDGTFRCEPIRIRRCPQGSELHPVTNECIQIRPCNRGYRFNVLTVACEDIDECREGVDSCTNTTQCVNYDGTYRCERIRIQCPQGSELHPSTNECVQLRSCNRGYKFNIVTLACEDINECAMKIDNCTPEQRCENNDGSFSCRRIVGCGTGYTLVEETQTCIDMDECELGTHNCGNGYNCVNIEGSFRCSQKQCPEGTRFNPRSGECERVNCPRGFRPDSRGMCIDVDECERPNICDVTQSCINTYGSYRCRLNYDCKPGTEPDPNTGTCIDIDECAYGSVCPYNAVCTNTPGSYKCECNQGLRQEGILCVDIDECRESNDCQHGCINVIGSYYCSCQTGYQLSVDQKTCEDINECRSTRGKICAGECINLPGSYRCSCPDGWRSLTGGRCKDIDECAEGSAQCQGLDAMCFNTLGSYRCPQIQCPSGFVRHPLGPKRNSVRCKRTSFTCRRNDFECINAPISLSYNFLSFPENVKIPSNLFAMSGPQTTEKIFNWELNVVNVIPRRADSIPANRGYFYLDIKPGEAVVALNYRIRGPQDIELELRMKITDRYTRYTGTAVSKIFLYVTAENIGS